MKKSFLLIILLAITSFGCGKDENKSSNINQSSSYNYLACETARMLPVNVKPIIQNVLVVVQLGHAAQRALTNIAQYFRTSP